MIPLLFLIFGFLWLCAGDGVDHDGDEVDGDTDSTGAEKDNENFGCARVIGQLAVSSESRM